MNALLALSLVLAGVAAGLAAWTATSAQGSAFLGGVAARLRVGARGLRSSGLGVSGRKAVAGGLEGVLKGVRAALDPRREARAHARIQAECLEELPDLIDVVALGMSAGISFDAALAIYCEKYDTRLSTQIADAMRSWGLGLATRSDALHELAHRLGLPAFTTFVDTATESLAFGAPLARSLSEQSQAVRRQRRSDVEERIEKAPVKMLVPTGTLILPAMLLAVLGPLLASLGQLSG